MYYFEQIILRMDKYLKFITPFIKLEIVVLSLGIIAGLGFNFFTVIKLSAFHFYLWIFISMIISVLLIIMFLNEDLDTKFIKDV